MNKNIKTIIWLFIFSVAMGYLETAVVVYLRMLYYPSGFSFPLAPLDYATALTEVLREAATIIMLVSVGIFTGKTRVSRFGNFVFCFAVWDICYYIFLKLLLNWPQHLDTWDILFLIPVPWVGPVWSPCLFSLLMIAFAIMVWYFERNDGKIVIDYRQWMLMITGTLMVFYSFIRDYLLYDAGIDPMVTRDDRDKLKELAQYMPANFPWKLYFTGFVIMVVSMFTVFFKNKKLALQVNKEKIKPVN